MHTAHKVMSVRTATGSNPHISMMVASTIHTWLIGDTQMPGVIVVPETLLRHMTRIRIIIILYISRCEILPGIMVLDPMFIRNGRIKPSLLQCAHAHHQMVVIGLRMGLCHYKLA